MSTALGPERNLLKPEPDSCRMIKILSPIIDNDDFAKMRNISVDGFRSVTLPMSFKSRKAAKECASVAEICSRRQAWQSLRRDDPHSFRPAVDKESRRFRACWRLPVCTIILCVKAHARKPR
jgi:hypothetical protein